MGKVFKKVVSALATAAIGGAIGVGVTGKIMGDKVNLWHQYSDKHLALYKMMVQWVRVKQEGKSLSSYLMEKEYNKIAIYGMSFAGEALIDELKGSGIEIAYAIDKNADNLYSEVEIITMDDFLEEVDAIIVTAITFFEEIEEKLNEKVSCPIISLEDILYEI